MDKKIVKIFFERNKIVNKYEMKDTYIEIYTLEDSILHLSYSSIGKLEVYSGKILLRLIKNKHIEGITIFTFELLENNLNKYFYLPWEKTSAYKIRIKITEKNGKVLFVDDYATIKKTFMRVECIDLNELNYLYFENNIVRIGEVDEMKIYGYDKDGKLELIVKYPDIQQLLKKEMEKIFENKFSVQGIKENSLLSRDSLVIDTYMKNELLKMHKKIEELETEIDLLNSYLGLGGFNGKKKQKEKN